MTDLYRELEKDRNAGIKMFAMLEAAELVATVRSSLAEPKLKRLGTVEKVYLGDTNLMCALVADPEIGAVRETFFVNQLRAAGHQVVTPQKGDFILDGRHLVEVGRGNKIPLWLFGFLY